MPTAQKGHGLDELDMATSLSVRREEEPYACSHSAYTGTPSHAQIVAAEEQPVHDLGSKVGTQLLADWPLYLRLEVGRIRASPQLRGGGGKSVLGRQIMANASR